MSWHGQIPLPPPARTAAVATVTAPPQLHAAPMRAPSLSSAHADDLATTTLREKQQQQVAHEKLQREWEYERRTTAEMMTRLRAWQRERTIAQHYEAAAWTKEAASATPPCLKAGMLRKRGGGTSRFGSTKFKRRWPVVCTTHAVAAH